MRNWSQTVPCNIAIMMSSLLHDVLTLCACCTLPPTPKKSLPLVHQCSLETLVINISFPFYGNLAGRFLWAHELLISLCGHICFLFVPSVNSSFLPMACFEYSVTVPLYCVTFSRRWYCKQIFSCSFKPLLRGFVPRQKVLHYSKSKPQKEE